MAADADSIHELATLWRERGWVLVPALVPADVIDSVYDELWSMFPPDDVFRNNPDDDRVKAFWQRQDPDLSMGDAPQDGPGFRPEQLLGTREFPFPASPNLNQLPLHSSILDFVRAALGATDIRLYLAQAWAKYTGVTNYEQPLHRDLNHSLVPQRAEQGWWQMEGFVYLHDIDTAADAPTCLVPANSAVDQTGRVPVLPEERPDLYELEEMACGPRGSFLAYRPDVWHRATDLVAPSRSRHVLAASFKHPGADWISFAGMSRHAPNFWFQQLVATCSPDQLAVLGFPAPGHPFWTRDGVDEFALMYPGLDTAPWSAALP